MLGKNIIFRQLFDPVSCTYTYLLGCARTKSAALIDGVLANVDRDVAVARELGVKLVVALDTHLHADHITSAAALSSLCGAKIAIGAASGAQGADLLLKDGDIVPVGELALECRSTPGHTNGCMTYVLMNTQPPCAFTGDALLIRGCGRTDFQQGDAAILYRSVKNKILSLPDDTLLFVGHDYRGATLTTVSEEKQYNPRVGGDVSESDFVGYMRNLNLPHPKQISEAVPANTVCGKASFEGQDRFDSTWAHLYRTVAGHYEVDHQWLEEHLGQPELVILDVRDEPEMKASKSMGRIPGSVLVPLDTAVAFVKEKFPDHNTRIVTVCRAGARSAQACVLLGREGYKRSASVAGGLLRWSREGRKVDDVPN